MFKRNRAMRVFALALPQINWHAFRRSALIVAVYLVIFTGLDWLTRAFQIFPAVVPWYPPDGVSFALLLSLGEGFSPALAIASLISSFLIYQIPLTPADLIGWAIAISLTYGLAAAFLRRRVRIDPQLGRQRDVVWLILAAMIAAAILTLISVPSLIAGGTVPADESLKAMIQWWIGEMVGVMVVTPALLIHVMPRMRRFVRQGQKFPKKSRLFQGAAPRIIWQAVSILFTLYLVFGLSPVLGEYQPIYLIALPLIWIALDSGLAGVSLGILAVNFGTTFALWAFQFDIEKLAELQFVMLGVSAVGLLTGIVVTERKQAEQTLRWSENRFRTLIENAPDAFLLLGVNGRVKYVSPSTGKIIGYTAQEAIGSDPAEATHPDDLPAVLSALADLVQRPNEAATLQYRFRHKDGSWRWLESTITNLINEPGVEAILFNYRDITEQKQAEQALRDNEKRFRSLIENGLDNISLINKDGLLIWESPAVVRTLEYAFNEFLGRNIFELVHPEDLELTRRLFAEGLGDPGGRRHIVFRLKHHDGSWRWVEAVGTNLLNEPSVQAVVINYRDITPRKQAQEALQKAEEKYHHIFENAIEGIYQTTPEGQYLTANPALARMFGYDTAEDLIGQVTDLNRRLYVDPGRRAEYKRLMDEYGSVSAFESEVYGKKGSRLWISENALAVKDEHGALLYYEGTAEDITARKRAEAEIKLRLAELEAINHVSTALRTAKTLDEMLPRLVEETLAVLGASAGSIWLHTPASEEVCVAFQRGWDYTPPPVKRGKDIPGYVVASGQAYVSREVKTDPLTPESIRGRLPPGVGAACVPIRAADQVIGALLANTELPHEYGTAELRLLTIIAEIAGNAIHRTRLHEQTRQQLERLAALRAIDEAISTSSDLKLTLNVLLGHVIQQLDVDAASVLLLNPHLHILEYAASQGFRTRGIEQSQLRLEEGHAGRAALERRIVHVPVLSTKGFTRTSLLVDEGFTGYYGVPLIIKGQVKGVLEIFHRTELNRDDEWVAFLESLAGQAAIAVDNAELFMGLQRSNIELAVAYDATIEGWSRALDMRDKETEGHTQRVTELTLKLARALDFGEAELVHVRRGALLHDIGKMGVPDAILLKPGRLNDKEWEIMIRHPALAYEMLSPVQYLQPALDIPYCHHEKWDGTGYPRGLKGEQIPLSARIFAVVDVWDALRSDRPYQKAWSEKKVREYIQSQVGKHFDPRVADRFLRLINVKKSQ